MKGVERYLERYAWPGPLIKERPSGDLEMVVVVPVYNEPHAMSALQALNKCRWPGCGVEVLAVINHPEDASPGVVKRSRETYEQIKSWSDDHENSRIKFFPVWAGGLKKKFAGPGLARKIGMDETVRRLNSAGKSNGLIVSFDADCICEENFLSEIFDLYKSKTGFRGCAVYYEHIPEPGENELSLNIINYELHLRYYSNALEYAGYPYPFHTIGSTMVVTAKAYIMAGGMNRRKAGEDFFFLQKIFPNGYFYYLNTTTVYPSSRASDRVPFGTGATMLKLKGGSNMVYPTYHIQTFLELEFFLTFVDRMFDADDAETEKIIKKLPPAIKAWLRENDFKSHLKRIRKNSASLQTYHKSFFQWLSRFQVLKYVHFARDRFYQNRDVLTEINELMTRHDSSWSGINNRKKLLEIMRKHDKNKDEKAA